LTLIVGIVCQDGVVLAADSASSDAETQTKQPTEKIRRLGKHPILCGGSGDVGLLQKIQEAMAGFAPQGRLKRIRQEIKGRIVPELQEAVKYHAPYPAAGFNRPPDGIHLFAGIAEAKPWLLEIEKDGRDTIYDEALGNFAAIGSGKPWAQAIFRPYLFTPRDLELGTILAYRVMTDAIELSSAFLAPPIHIWRIPVDGEPNEVGQEEIDTKLKNVLGLWRAMETEVLGKLRAQSQPETAAEIPGPQEDTPEVP
jgi:proteasome beta subunit